MWFLVLAVFILFMFLFYAAFEKDERDNEGIVKLKMVDDNERLVKDIFKVLEEKHNGLRVVYYNNMRLSVCGLVTNGKTGEIEEVHISYKERHFRLCLHLRKNNRCSKEELIEILDVLRFGTVKYSLKTLLVRYIQDDWFFNGEIYVNPNTNEQVVFGKFKVFYTPDLFYTTEELEKFKPSEHPRKIHWKEFLEEEMKAKKQREVHCHKYVDDILQKQITYNDLNLQYQMLPSAPITDVESFRNFCKVVHEDTKYEDYEIQNYLLLKKSMQ